MNDAARKEDELSKQDSGRWKRRDVLLLCTWTMAHHYCDKNKKQKPKNQKTKSNISLPKIINRKTMSTKKNHEVLVLMLLNLIFCVQWILCGASDSMKLSPGSGYYQEDSQIILNAIQESHLLQYNVLIDPRHRTWQISSRNILQTSLLYFYPPCLLYCALFNMANVVCR